jgi:hypothetical protein
MPVTTAPLRFSVPPAVDTKVYTTIFDPNDPDWARETNFGYEMKDVVIANFREREEPLDSLGFQFLKCPTGFTAFSDDSKVKEFYYPEVIEILKRATGASRVMISFNVAVYRQNRTSNIHPSIKPPIHLVQVYFSPAGAMTRVRSSSRRTFFAYAMLFPVSGGQCCTQSMTRPSQWGTIGALIQNPTPSL